MTWEEKAKMVSMLNKGEYKQAKDLILHYHKTEGLDEQAVVMFVNGYSVIDKSLDSELIQALSSVEVGDLRAKLRIEIMKDLIGKGTEQ